MATRLVNGKRETLTPQEEIDLTAFRAAEDIQAALDAVQHKKDELIAYEKEQAIETLILTRKTQIEAMDEAGIDAALLLAGLRN